MDRYRGQSRTVERNRRLRDRPSMTNGFCCRFPFAAAHNCGVQTSRTALLLIALTVAVASLAPPASLVAQDGSFAIRDVRVFDGDRVISRATVVVASGTITAVGPDVAAPSGVEVFDGAGRTLLPGFIDAHTHTRTADDLESALAFGVTTQLDMSTLPSFAASMRREQAEGRANTRADLFSASTAVTTPGGHGSMRAGGPPPMLSTAAEADAFVAARIEEGADYIKIIIE